MNEKIMKQVSENEDSAIKLLNDVKRFRTGLNEIKEYIENPRHEMSVKTYQELLQMIDSLLESEK